MRRKILNMLAGPTSRITTAIVFSFDMSHVLMKCKISELWGRMDQFKRGGANSEFFNFLLVSDKDPVHRFVRKDKVVS